VSFARPYFIAFLEPQFILRVLLILILLTAQVSLLPVRHVLWTGGLAGLIRIFVNLLLIPSFLGVPQLTAAELTEIMALAKEFVAPPLVPRRLLSQSRPRPPMAALLALILRPNRKNAPLPLVPLVHLASPVLLMAYLAFFVSPDRLSVFHRALLCRLLL